MRLFLLAVIVLNMAGCMRVVFGEAASTAAQANVDLKEAAYYIEEEATSRQDYPTALAAQAVIGHADNMAKAMRIEPDEFPNPRVKKNDWKTDPNEAAMTSNKNIKSDGMSIERATTIGLAALSIAMVGVRLGQVMLKSHPVLGPMLSGIGTLFGYNSRTKDLITEKMYESLEEYKKMDPKWEEHPIYKLLSTKLTQTEKDYIKAHKHDA